MGGLTTAAKLVEKGAKVVVLEKYLVPGGSAAHFKREGYTFDVGSSMMFGFGDQGTTNLITKALGAVGKKMQTVPDPSQVHYHLPKSDKHPQASAVKSGVPLGLICNMPASDCQLFASWVCIQSTALPKAYGVGMQPCSCMLLNTDLLWHVHVAENTPAFLSAYCLMSVTAFAKQGLNVQVWRQYEDFVRELSARFPHESSGIKKFYDECWRVFNALNSLELKSLEEPKYLMGEFFKNPVACLTLASYLITNTGIICLAQKTV